MTKYPTEPLPPQTELLVLYAISSHEKGLHGLAIQKAIAQCSLGLDAISTGTLYATTKRLEEKGFISKHRGPSVSGGADRKNCQITESGRKVIESANLLFERLQSWVPE